MSPPRSEPPGKVAPTDNVSPLMDLFRDVARKKEEGLARAAKEGLPDIVRAVGETLKDALGAIPGGQWIADRIDPPPIRLAPASASPAEKYEHYERILESRGFTLHPTEPTVLAIRGMNNSGTIHDTTSKLRYDDTMVVLNRDAQGNPQVTTLPGSTHPGSPHDTLMGKSGVPSVDNDKVADVGMLDPGEYLLVRRSGPYNGAEAWDVRTLNNSGLVPGTRDMNHDGKYEVRERAIGVAAVHTMTGVMIHQGADGHPQSAGCLNLSSNPTIYPAFANAMGDSAESKKLIVLDANRQ